MSENLESLLFLVIFAVVGLRFVDDVIIIMLFSIDSPMVADSLHPCVNISHKWNRFEALPRQSLDQMTGYD